MGFGVGLGFRCRGCWCLGLRFRVWGLGFRVQGSAFGVFPANVMRV